jgi:hypothetical protein
MLTDREILEYRLETIECTLVKIITRFEKERKYIDMLFESLEEIENELENIKGEKIC